MKIILAPDSFKNCLRAPQVAACLERGIRAILPETELYKIPLADGGEGTVEAVCCATGAAIRRYTVTDPFGRPISAEAALLSNGIAVLEMASAAGLELLTTAELNPMKTTTWGVGCLIRQLLADESISQLILGLGGSATVDGGLGMMQALGCRFYAGCRELPPGAGGGALNSITRIDSSDLLPELHKLSITAACDVTTPLPDAAAIFGPQKGATPQMVRELTAGLKHWSALWQDSGMTPGDGAAGGLGFALRKLLGADHCSGAELLLDLAEFDKHCDARSWVLTGEGRSDIQSAAGKLCGAVARRARNHKAHCILVSGALSDDFPDMPELYTAIFSITSGPISLAEALRTAPKQLERFGKNFAGILQAFPMNP